MSANQRAWETAMGMAGHSGSPAQAERSAEIELLLRSAADYANYANGAASHAGKLAYVRVAQRCLKDASRILRGR